MMKYIRWRADEYSSTPGNKNKTSKCHKATREIQIYDIQLIVI